MEATFVNCSIVGNSANYKHGAGGVHLLGVGTVSFQNCSIAGNVSAKGPAVYKAKDAGSLTFQNTVVAANLGDSEPIVGSYTSTDSLIGVNPGFVCPPIFENGTLTNADSIDLRLAPYSTYVDYPQEGYLGAYEFTGERVPLACNVVTTLEDEFDLTNDAVSLREALYLTPNDTKIVFAPGLSGTIYLDSTLEIMDSPQIDGDGRIVLDGQGANRVLLVWNGTPRFEGLTITNGRADGSGGGVYVRGGANFAFVHCSITGNETFGSSDVFGGGVFVSNNAGGTFENCVISDNVARSSNNAAYGGGVALCDSSPVSFVNCVVSDNIANGANGYGGGVYLTTETHIYATFVNCALANNSADYGGAMLTWYDARSSITFQNSIAVMNESNKNSDWTDIGGRASAFNTLSSYAAWYNASDSGVVNYVYDPSSPLFVDPENGDYRLALNSQAIDLGNNAYVSLDKDLAGATRIVNGVVDLGPYESGDSNALDVPALTISQIGEISFVATIGAVANADRYVLEYATSSNFQGSTIATYDTAGAKPIYGLTSATTYYVRVKALSAGELDDSPWSSVLEATTTIPAPSLFVLSKTTNSITLAIGEVANAARYVLAIATDPSFASSTNQNLTSAGTKTISGLASATTYYFRVMATGTGLGSSAWSRTVNAKTDVSTPTLAFVSKTATSVSLTIGEIANAARYVVEFSTSSDFAMSVASRSFNVSGDATIGDLDPATTYYFRVKAVMSDSSESSPSGVVEVETDFGAPIFSLGEKTASTVALTLTGVGASPKLEIWYWSVASPEIRTQMIATSANILVDYLRPATTYSFRARAIDENEAPLSDWSYLETTTSLETPALYVLPDAATANSISLVVGKVDGATGYSIQYSTDPAFSVSDPSTQTASYNSFGAKQISGLIPATEYYFRVKATSQEFDESAWSTEDVKETTKLAVSTLEFVAKTADSVTISLGAVENAIEYTVVYALDSQFSSGKKSETFYAPGLQTISGLNPATEYYFYVVASANDGYESPRSGSISAATNLATPSLAVVGQSVDAIDFSIESVDRAGNYLVQWSTDSSFASILGEKTIEATEAQALSDSIPNLVSGTIYYLRVKAISDDRDPSKWSAEPIAATVVFPSPALAFIAKDATSATLTIGSVPNAGLYELQYSTDSRFDNSVASVTTRAYLAPGIKKIDALTSATTYYFRVRAASASGEVGSEWTALDASTNLATPSLAVKSVTSVSATLSIGAVDRAQNYVVEFSNDPAFDELDPSTTTRAFDEPGNATIDGLTAGNAYYFRVKATSDSFDDGAWSTEDVLAIATIEAPVLSAIRSIDASTINLTLDYPDGFAGSFVLQYSTDPKFEYADAPVTTRAFASPGTKTIGDLKAASTYYFRVKASAEGIEDSDWSNVLDASTCLPTPNFSFSYASDSSVILTIESIPEARKYEVFYADFQFDANASPLPDGVTRLVVVPNGSQAIMRQISGLASDAPYYFYVKASATEPALYGPSPKKSSAPRTTALPLYLDSSLGCGVCNIVRSVLAAPSLCVEKSTARSVTLSINESNLGSAFVAPTYVVQYSTFPDFPEGDPSRDSTWNGELVATETGGWVQTEFENLTFDNLAPGTTYYFRIKAKSSTLGVSDSVWSEGLDVSETTAIGLGAPPLAVASTTANSATINIGAIQGCEIYEVEYGTDPEFKVAERRNISSSGLGTIQNLAPATTYYFRVRATGSGRDATLWSGVAAANTALETPSLAVEAISPDSATIRLGQSGRAQLYAVEFGTNPSFDDASVRFYNAPGVKTISGLTPGATYYFRVRANATGYSDSAISATVEAKTALPTPKISAFVVENDSLSFNLEPLAGSEGYFVQYGTDRNFASDYTTELFYETSGEKRIEGLLPGTLYYLRVKSKFAREDFTGDSDWVVLPATTGFAAPTLTVGSLSSSSVVLNIGASANAKNYVVEFGTDPRFASATSKTFATPGEKTISGLEPDATYYFRVKASAPGRGESPLSTVVDATTESIDDSRLVVYRTDDSATRTGTLRNAIARANDGETIFVDLEPGETIELSAELVVDKAITIDASSCWDDSANAPGVAIVASGASRVFTISASATLVGLTITGGKASEGGGILVAEGADATLARCVVTGNQAYDEPESSADYNPVKAWGGGISARGNLTLDRCVVVDNVASTPEHSRSAYCYGGGVYVAETGELTARETTIAENQTRANAQYRADSLGAGLYASGPATLVDCVARANESLFASPNPSSASALFSYGGGVFVVRSLTVDNSRFVDNSALQKGGAIHVSQGAKVEIANDSTFERNRTTSFGGAIYSEGDLTVSEGCALIANQSESGGAIYSSGKLTLADAVVRDNLAESGYLAMGGGLYVSGDAIVENVSIYNNAARVPGSTTGASALGGAVYANSSRDVALTNCSIVDNYVETNSTWTATAQGGGIYSNFVGANLTVTNCEISGNSASTSTTGSSQYATATSQGGGIYAARALALVNSTVVANSVDASGAFVSTAGDGAFLQRYAQTDAFSLDNSIVILNGAAEDDLRRSDVETVVLGRNSLSSFDEWTNKTQPGVVNYGYSRLEPLFEDFEGGDYRPASNSQLVDRGDPASFPSGLDVDLDGNDRFYRTIDVGAYERVGDKEPRLASPEIELERDGDELAVNIVAKDDSAERYVLDYAVLSTRSGGSTLSYETISFDSPGVKTLPGVPADATIRYRLRAEALGRVSSLWARDLTGAETASAKWVPATEPLPDSLEPNDSRESAVALGTLATPVSYELGLSSASDVDWLALETVATGGEENSVRVEYARSNDGTALTLDLYDARGRKVATSSAATGVESVSFNNLSAGKYWIKISNPRPDGRAADYRLTIDPPVAIETKLPRPVVSVASSASGATVRIETVEGASGYLVQYGTDPDFVDAVEKTYLSGGAKTLSGLAPSTKYYVRVRAFANAPTDPSDAQNPLSNDLFATDSDWTLATVTTDANRDRFEPNDLQEESRDLGAISGEVRFDSLNLHSGVDVDWYKFEPTPGAELTIALTSASANDANLAFELFDVQGNRVEISSSVGGVESITIQNEASEYWLRVVNRAPRPSAANYSLQFAERAILPSPAISIDEVSIDSATVVIGSVSDATRYLLQYDVAPDFSTPTELLLTEPGSLEIEELLPETTYYFRVKAIAEGRPDSDWSETSATTSSDVEEQLDPPTITGTTTTKVAVTFKINAVSDATGFFVEYGTDPNFASPATKNYASSGSKTVSGLAFGTKYYFRVKATADGFADSDWTTFEATTKNATFPSAPTLTPSESTTDSISVEIGAVASAEQYVLEYSTSANFATAASLEFASPGVQTVSNLASGTTYYFRVKATAERYDDSAWSEAISAATLDPTTTPLDVPTITALSGTKTAIVVKFDAIDGAAKYVVEYSTDSKFSNPVSKTYSTAGSKTISGLPTGTWYYVRMKATATGRPDSAYTEVRKIYTGGSYAMPSFTFSTVKTAVVLNIKPGKIDANQGAPEKYVVEYSESPDFSNARTKTVAQGVEADGTLKPCKPTISGLTFGTAYYFRVKATGSLGNDSAWYANNGKPIAAGQLAVPTFFTSKIGTDFINVRCYNSAGASGFEVMFSTSSDFANPRYAQCSASSGTVALTGLDPNTKYYYKVRALGDNVSRVDSTWSVIVNNATTKPATTSSALLDEDSDFENYFEDDDLDAFWDVLAKSVAK
ncbi:MAG: hypothetical protein IJM30_06070 [Thermoguttaceae bacterium]|nr:hypothetical protein [Thermoguttaceae bacterium]